MIVILKRREMADAIAAAALAKTLLDSSEFAAEGMRSWDFLPREIEVEIPTDDRTLKRRSIKRTQPKPYPRSAGKPSKAKRKGR